jgi:hypothetical protein
MFLLEDGIRCGFSKTVSKISWSESAPLAFNAAPAAPAAKNTEESFILRLIWLCAELEQNSRETREILI